MNTLLNKMYALVFCAVFLLISSTATANTSQAQQAVAQGQQILQNASKGISENYEKRSADDFLKDFDSVYNFIANLSILLGVVLVIYAMFQFKQSAVEPNRYTVKGAALTFFSGVMLFSFDLMMNIVQETIYGNEFNAATEGAYLNSTTVATVASNSVAGSNGNTIVGSGLMDESGAKIFIGFAMVVGIIYFIKGLYMLHQLGGQAQQGNASISKALTHIFGGALAFNVSETACVIGSTVGFSALCM